MSEKNTNFFLLELERTLQEKQDILSNPYYFKPIIDSFNRAIKSSIKKYQRNGYNSILNKFINFIQNYIKEEKELRNSLEKECEYYFSLV